jgi:glycosyltransferase involved in cell wall biosynthesis
MRLAFISPLPPSPTGVAEYSASIVRELRRKDYVDASESMSALKLQDYDVRLYQVGNNRLHDGAYEAALRVPGIVELHDATVHHLLLGRLDRAAYVEEFVYNYGKWATVLAGQMWERRSLAPSEELYFGHPLLRRVLEKAEKIVVHNPGAAMRAREANPDVEVVQIPHYVEPAQEFSPEEIAAVRRRFRVPEGGILISSFGYHRPPKRLQSMLRAAEGLETPHRILIAGDFVSPTYEASLEGLMQKTQTIRLPHVPDKELARLIAATDVCVNLRWPTAGETSGFVMKLMAAGKPVLVTQCEENADLPDNSVLKIEPGINESAMIEEALRMLTLRPELRLAMGELARKHVLREHSLDKVAEQYRELWS